MRTPSGPFRGSWARSTGLLSPRTLVSHCARLAPDVYVHRSVELTPVVRATGTACWAGPAGVLTGWSSAAVLGARWLPADHDQEVSLPHHRAGHPGLVVHQHRFSPDEVEDADGVRVTTPARTAFDLGRRLPLVAAVSAVDQLCALGVCGPAAVAAVAEQHPGDRGLVRLARVLDLVDPGAQSPRESALRVLLVCAGLPRPATQVEVRGTDGRFLARADLGWERWRVLVEYEGAHHRSGSQFTRDVDRHHALEQAGWVVVRVTAGLLDRQPDEVVRRVATALHDAGAQW